MRNNELADELIKMAHDDLALGAALAPSGGLFGGYRAFELLPEVFAPGAD